MKSAIQSPAIWLTRALISLSLAFNSLGQPADSAPALGATTLRALILSGEGSHDWRTSTPFLRRLLLDSGRFDVRITESPAGITARTLTGFDVIVDDYCGPRLGKEAEKAIADFIRAGHGLVVTSGALAPAAGGGFGKSNWPGFAQLTKASWPAIAKAGVDAPFQLLDLKPAGNEHPVMQGLQGHLKTGDRPCRGFFLLPGAEVLATTGQGEPLLFASSFGQGRVFCTALGHDLGPMQETTFITTFVRGAEWAASGRVTLPAEIRYPAADKRGVRVLVIAGGHDHESSFYGLFDGYQDLASIAVSDSTLAFQDDIRAKYDVLVFYNFTRNLDDKAKKNLRDFVESHKGILVLHHGILSFQNWPWWYEEVVGGLYRLESHGNIPNSTVKFGEEHLVTPAGDHPITKGIGAFHVTDETYKGLFISPNIKPLLTTDNPTSDPTVAWIGPCATSKVVFIQLGHDHLPFRHPAYRAFVHNAILWTAGRLN